jgi:protoporphyrinogen oxidase
MNNYDFIIIGAGCSGLSLLYEMNKSNILNLVFLARHVRLKGIYDLPKINQGLLDRNVLFNWTILG